MAELSSREKDVLEGPSVRLLSLILLTSLPLGYFFIYSGLAATGGSGIKSYFVSFSLFVAQDMWIGPVTFVLLVAALASGRRMEFRTLAASPRMPLAAVALVSAGFVFALRLFAFDNYGRALDEFMPLFQADIFRGGNFMAPLSNEAVALNKALQPYLVYVDETRGVWAEHYRPVHAALLSLFPRGQDVAIAHAFLTIITIYAMADIARRLFPDRPGAPILAAMLLVASPQFLLTAASGFSFTMHLAFNTLWLALFLQGSWAAHVVAATVGFFALGIHQVHVHAIQVFPFGVAMLLGHFGNRWKTVPYILAYGIGMPFWICWPEVATWLQTGDFAALPRSLGEVEYFSNYANYVSTAGKSDRTFTEFFLVLNIWRFVLWMSPAMMLLVAVAVYSRGSLSTVPFLAGLGFIFTVLISHILLPNQSNTIGSRYYHAAIVNLVVVALAVYHGPMANSRLRQSIIPLLVAGMVIFLPWRVFQMYESVAPRATIQAKLEDLGAENIIVRVNDFTPVWHMMDFVRNDPYLKRPPTYYFSSGDEPVIPIGVGKTITISGYDLENMGLERGTYLEPAIEP